MSHPVFCYGEIGVDNIIHIPHLPSPELAAFPTGESYHIGGAAANTGVWLANWGIATGLAGNAIGTDPYGEQLWGWLSEYGALNLSHVERRKDVITPFCRVMVTPDAERSFLVYWYPQTPKIPLTAEMLTGTTYLALDLYGGDERVEAAKTAQEVGVQTVIGDVIWADHPILPLTDIATNSAAYIRETFPGIEIREHARALQAISGGIVVLTDGSRPVFAIDRDGSAYTVQPPQVKAVDATGAGDAFRAGLLAGLLDGLSLGESLCWGAAAGSFGVQSAGAASQPASLEAVKRVAAALEVWDAN